MFRSSICMRPVLSAVLQCKYQLGLLIATVFDNEKDSSTSFEIRLVTLLHAEE